MAAAAARNGEISPPEAKLRICHCQAPNANRFAMKFFGRVVDDAADLRIVRKDLVVDDALLLDGVRIIREHGRKADKLANLGTVRILTPHKSAINVDSHVDGSVRCGCQCHIVRSVELEGGNGFSRHVGGGHDDDVLASSRRVAVVVACNRRPRVLDKLLNHTTEGNGQVWAMVIEVLGKQRAECKSANLSSKQRSREDRHDDGGESRRDAKLHLFFF